MLNVGRERSDRRDQPYKETYKRYLGRDSIDQQHLECRIRISFRIVDRIRGGDCAYSLNQYLYF